MLCLIVPYSHLLVITARYNIGLLSMRRILDAIDALLMSEQTEMRLADDASRSDTGRLSAPNLKKKKERRQLIVVSKLDGRDVALIIATD